MASHIQISSIILTVVIDAHYEKTLKAFSKKIAVILAIVRFKQMLIVEVHLRNKEDIKTRFPVS